MLTVYAFVRVATVVQGHGGSFGWMLSRQLVGSALVSAVGNPDEDILFFDLERIESLLAVFEAICRSLQVTSKDDPLAEIIATKVTEASGTGERDPDRLRHLVLLALRNA